MQEKVDKMQKKINELRKEKEGKTKRTQLQATSKGAWKRRVMRPSKKRRITKIIYKMDKSVKLPKFKEDQVEAYCASLNTKILELMDAGETDPDRRIMGKISESLEGNVTAQVWYNRMREQGSISSVAELCTELRKTYGGTTNIMGAEEKLREVKQAEKENISKYALRMKVHAKESKMTLHLIEVKKAFIKGMRSDRVKEKAYKAMNESLGEISWEELVETAKRAENNFSGVELKPIPKPAIKKKVTVVEREIVTVI